MRYAHPPSRQTMHPPRLGDSPAAATTATNTMQREIRRPLTLLAAARIVSEVPGLARRADFR
jgi:hypothetical protein